MKALRIEVPDTFAAGDLPPHDYASAFELPIPQTETRSPQEWARAVFEDAPRPVRLAVRGGWRFPLLFEAAKPGPGQVLGARIASTGPAWLILEQRSPLMQAYNVVSVEEARIVWVTVVSYRRRIARPLWAISAVIHHRVLPYLLTRAARS